MLFSIRWLYRGPDTTPSLGGKCLAGRGAYRSWIGSRSTAAAGFCYALGAMNRLVRSISLVVLCFVSPTAFADYPGESWAHHRTPEAAGFDAGALQSAETVADDAGAAAVVIVVDGKLVAAWGDPEGRYPCHSIRKSFIAALFGPAVAGGYLDLDATLASLGIDDNVPLTEAEKQATVRHLLMGRSGVYLASNASSPRMASALPERGTHAPGTFWLNNNWDANALGTIYAEVTGEDVFSGFGRAIAGPIAMEHFDPSRHTRWVDDGESRHRGYGFTMSALDMARFGHLILRDGQWRGQQLVAADWVTGMTAPHSPIVMGDNGPEHTDDAGDAAYGYMWWVGSVSALVDRPLLEGSFSAQGMGGHMVLIVPKIDMVFAIRANTWLPTWTPLITTRLEPDAVKRIVDAVLDAYTGPQATEPNSGR